MQQEVIFTVTIDAQEIRVRYRPRYFTSADYAHFEFTSPYEPRRRIPVSETGYLSHFSPMHEIEAAPSVEEYARALVLALMQAESCIDTPLDALHPDAGHRIKITLNADDVEYADEFIYDRSNDSIDYNRQLPMS